MADCPGCGAELKTIPAGISKSTGKPYDSFISCSNRCGWKPSKENGVRKVLVESTQPSHIPNGELKEKSMLMSYAKDIVVALISRDQIIGEVGKEVVAIYNTLLEGLTHPLGKV